MERTVELTADELAELNAKLDSAQNRVGCGGGLAVLLAAFCFLVCLYCFYMTYLQLQTISFGMLVQHLGYGLYLLIGIISLIVMLGLLWLLKSYFQAPKSFLDARTVRKKIITAPVEEQKLDIDENVKRSGKINQTTTMDYKFTVTVAGQKYPVTEDNYYKLNPGRLAEVHHLISLEKRDVQVFLGVFPAEENKESDV